MNSVCCVLAAGACVYGHPFETKAGATVYGSMDKARAGEAAASTAWNVSILDTSTGLSNAISY